MDKNPTRIYLSIEYFQKELAKMIPTASWEKSLKQWSFHYDHAELIKRYFPHKQEAVDTQLRDIQSAIKDKTPSNERSAWLKQYKFKRAPRTYQAECINRLLLHNKYGLFLDCGLGKTQTAINTIDILKQYEDETYKALIVCPKSVMVNWREEVEINSGLSAVVIDGTKRQRQKLMAEDHDIYIINYEGVAVLSGKKPNKWEYDFSDIDIVVLDEAHKIKNASAIRTRIITALFRDAKYKYILTGTPISQNIVDLFAQFRFLDPDILGHKSVLSFRNHYCVMGGYGGYEIVGHKETEHLKEKIYKNAVRIKKKDVLPELPDKIYSSRTLKLSGELLKQYETMENELVLEFKDQPTLVASIVLTKLLRLQEILSGHYVDAKDNVRLQELKEIIETNRGDGNKFVVWVRFIKSLKDVELMLLSMGVKYHTLYGETKDRQKVITDFNTGDTEVIVGQIDTGGEGINLTSGNIIVYYENGWSLKTRHQTEDRCHRIGIKSSPTYIDLVFDETIDTHILGAIREKKEISEMVVDAFKYKMGGK